MAAAHAGADAIGMVFYKPAPRCVTIETAREILAVLPPFVTPVGLFVDADLGEMREIIESLGLRHIQLHGHETAATIAALHDRIVLKAVRVSPDTIAGELEEWRQAISKYSLRNLRGFVLETAGKGVGGTGVENNWELIAELQKQGAFDGLPQIIAAGGLRPENVVEVIRQLKPWAVDVSSGVEGAPGQKSAKKIDAFVDAVCGCCG